MRYLPNILGLSRLLMAGPLAFLVLLDMPWSFLGAAALVTAASMTDVLDGYIARRLGIDSALGVFLDLTADKVLACAVLVALVQIAAIPAWIAIVILSRDILVSGVRSAVIAAGRVLGPSPLGKQKTVLTMGAIGGVLLARGLNASQPSPFPLRLVLEAEAGRTWAANLGNLVLSVAGIVLLVSVVLTIVSGLDYLLRGASLLREEQKVSR